MAPFMSGPAIARRVAVLDDTFGLGIRAIGLLRGRRSARWPASCTGYRQAKISCSQAVMSDCFANPADNARGFLCFQRIRLALQFGNL
jgi:hypothetical protein